MRPGRPPTTIRPRCPPSARAFYEKLIELARGQDVPLVCAEIETEPVCNEPSLRFHTGFGFQEVGTKPYGEGATVSLQALELS